MSSKVLSRSLANLIASSRTRIRAVSLCEFHEWLVVAIEELGGVEQVAERIGLSKRMISQFLSYGRLSKCVQGLVRQRRIDSVDVISYLSRFQRSDQQVLARAYVEHKITSQDIRAIYQQRKLFPESRIEVVMDRVLQGKTIKQYVLKFVAREGVQKAHVLSTLGAVIDRRNILDVSFSGPIGQACVTAEGLRRLKDYARESRIPFKGVLSGLIYASVEQ